VIDTAFALQVLRQDRRTLLTSWTPLDREDRDFDSEAPVSLLVVDTKRCVRLGRERGKSVCLFGSGCPLHVVGTETETR
jgi:hypothetical protein